MALGDPYITAVQLGSYIGIDPDIAADDTDLADAAAAASKDINLHCGRDFNQAATPSARIFLPKSPYLVFCDDFFTTVGLEIQVLLNGQPQGQVLGAGEFELLPMNGYVDGEYRPYTGFRIPWPQSRFFWQFDRLQVTARWGWDSVPSSVVQAAKIRGAELYKLADAPLGVVQVGSGNNGVAAKAREVPHWQSLICGYQTQEKKVFLA